MIRIPKPNYLLRLYLSASRSTKQTGPDLAEIKAILGRYDLGSWQVYRQLGGGNSFNLLLQTERGKKVLKQYYWSLPSTRQEHSILRHLAERNFPTPKLEINKQGQTYTEWGDKHYAIYDFAEGYCYTNYLIPAQTRQQLVAEAGKTLARFHQLMAGFRPEGRKFNGFKPDGQQLWRGISWHLEVVEQYLEQCDQKQTLNELDHFALTIIDEIKQDIVEVGRHYEQPQPHFPRLVIHGDYSPKNIFFKHKKITSVLDFGDACLNLRAADVARGLTTFAQEGRYGVNERLARTFLQAYQGQQPLFAEEIAIVSDLTRWRYLQNIIWSLRSSGSQRKSLKKYLLLMQEKWQGYRWMKSYGDQLSASLMD